MVADDSRSICRIDIHSPALLKIFVPEAIAGHVIIKAYHVYFLLLIRVGCMKTCRKCALYRLKIAVSKRMVMLEVLIKHSSPITVNGIRRLGTRNVETESMSKHGFHCCTAPYRRM